MRNRYAGTCYRCGLIVEPGQGHFERHQGGWRTQHASCCIAAREAKFNAQEGVSASPPPKFQEPSAGRQESKSGGGVMFVEIDGEIVTLYGA